MHASITLLSIVIISSHVLAQANTSRVPGEIPLCTQQCTIKVLDPMNCRLANLTQCLCTNMELAKGLSSCVLESCTLIEQVESVNILQNIVCKGVPQASRSEELIRSIAIMLAVSIPIISLRFVSRSLVAKEIGWDDWAVALGALMMIPMAVIPIFNATRGFGKHFWDVPPQNIPVLRKLYYISQVFYLGVHGSAKISMLLLYHRIFLDKRFRLVTIISMVGIIIQTFAGVVAVLSQCIPINSYWDVTIPGKCINSQAFVYALAGLGIFEDFLIMFLPVWELKRLHLNRWKKIIVGFVFALGSFACITSMVRLKYIVSYGHSIDLTYDNVNVVLWSVLEAFTAMICTSLVCIQPLLTKFLQFLPKLQDSGSNPTSNQSWTKRATPTLGPALGRMLHNGNKQIQLSSLDAVSGGERRNGILVQTTLVVESSERKAGETKQDGW